MNDFEREMAQRQAAERQRIRERLGINAAAEMGVFDKGRPKELDVVAQRDAWLAEQFDRETNPNRYTNIPILHDDGPPTQREVVVAADWDAPLVQAAVHESYCCRPHQDGTDCPSE